MVYFVPNVDARKLLSMMTAHANVKVADLWVALIIFFISFRQQWS